MERGRWQRIAAGQRATPRPLLAPGARPAAAALAVLCAAVLTALAIRYAGHTQAGPLEARVDGWIQGHLGVTSPALSALTLLGDPLPVTIMTVLIALACVRARWWRAVVLAVLAAPVTSGLTEDVLKPAIGRTLHGGLTMPSGHTTAVFTLATLGAVLLGQVPGRPLLILAAYVLAAAVAIAMVAQGYHYFTDTIGGAAVGTGAVLAGAFVIDAAAGPVRGRLGLPADVAGDRPAPLAGRRSSARGAGTSKRGGPGSIPAAQRVSGPSSTGSATPLPSAPRRARRLRAAVAGTRGRRG